MGIVSGPVGLRWRVRRVRRLSGLILSAALLAPSGVVLAQQPQPQEQQQPQQSDKDAVYEQLNLFDEAFERIRQDAVDPVADKKLVDAAISGMLSGLDPHAAYIDPAEYQALNAPAGSDEVGIGVALALDKGQLKVISPRDGSPAATAGIEPGDLIFSIGKEPTYEMTLAEAERKLRGPPGSTVALVLQRGSGGPIKIKVKRAGDQLQTVTDGSKTAISAICVWPASTMARRPHSPPRCRICGAGAGGKLARPRSRSAQ